MSPSRSGGCRQCCHCCQAAALAAVEGLSRLEGAQIPQLLMSDMEELLQDIRVPLKTEGRGVCWVSISAEAQLFSRYLTKQLVDELDVMNSEQYK